MAHTECSACGKSKPRDEFSKNQMSKPATTRRCKQCITAGDSPASKAAHGGAWGKCRVRDVQRLYGHVCEIPLQAYEEAGVAFSWNDMVTAEDVEAASDAWDARSIAHDIDTQWGDMPWGGAYKDSNRYWGPGEYDYY